MTPEEVARAFAALDDVEQAEAIVGIGLFARGWGRGRREQWRALGRSLRNMGSDAKVGVEVLREILAAYDGAKRKRSGNVVDVAQKRRD